MVDKKQIEDDLIQLEQDLGLPIGIIGDDLVEIYYLLAQECQERTGETWQPFEKEYGQALGRWTRIYLSLL